MKASLQPNNSPISTKAISLTNGEVTRKEKAIPEGIPALIKPMNKGIEEQEQKGVIEPKIEAIKLPEPKRAFDIIFLIFEVGKNVLKKETTKTTTKINNSILVKL